MPYLTPPTSFNFSVEYHYYVLIDLALDKTFYQEIESHQLKHKSLVAGTVDRDAWEAAPMLIELDKSNPKHGDFLTKLCHLQQSKPAVIWIKTKLPFSPLFNLLRNCLYMDDPAGNPLFARFYDHLCLPYFLPVFYNAPETKSDFEKIDIFAIWRQDKKEYVIYYKEQFDDGN